MANINPSSSSSSISTLASPFDTPITGTTTTNSTNSPDDLSATLAKYTLTPSKLLDIEASLIAIARTAGQMMLDASPSTSTSSSSAKRNTSDLVTATDRAIESAVQTYLITAYPSILFLGEETHTKGQTLTSAPTFICDPIDGTLNFIHGFPNVAVSLALTINKQPVIGVVYNPFRRDLYTAVKNNGAFLTVADGSSYRLPLRGGGLVTPPLESLNGCLVGLEWGSERRGANWALRSDMARSLLAAKPAEGTSEPQGAMCHSVRSSGSAALDFCYVAAGQLDLFWEGGCWIWDVCGGWCVLLEAGGLVASANPGDWHPTLEGRCYLAVRGAKRREQEGVVREVWELMGGRRFVF